MAASTPVGRIQVTGRSLVIPALPMVSPPTHSMPMSNTSAYARCLESTSCLVVEALASATAHSWSPLPAHSWLYWGTLARTRSHRIRALVFPSYPSPAISYHHSRAEWFPIKYHPIYSTCRLVLLEAVQVLTCRDSIGAEEIASLVMPIGAARDPASLIGHGVRTGESTHVRQRRPGAGSGVRPRS